MLGKVQYLVNGIYLLQICLVIQRWESSNVLKHFDIEARLPAKLKPESSIVGRGGC